MSDVGLGATLQLDIADALSRIEQVGAQLAAATTGIPVTLDQPDATPVTASIDDAVQAADTTVKADADSGAVTTSIDEAVGAADVTVPISADTGPAEAEIAGLDSGLPNLTVGVDADTSPATAAVAEVVAVADAEVATIVVEADTSGADQAIADVGASADSSSGGVDKLTGSLTALKGSTSDATGLAAGLGTVVGEHLPAQFAGAAAGVTAFIGVTKGLFDAGVDAIAAEQRLTIATGQFKDAVENIHVGTLSTDIKGLAQQTGSTVVPIENAASRIFTLGKTSGEAGDSIAATSGKILALAGFLRSTNPSLGETGDIADRLTNALARGGRALQQFGLSAAAADINAEALRETGKKSASELTQYEKAAADATLQTQKLGGSFQTAFAEGQNNPVIQIGQIKAEFVALFEEIGKPLVSPVVQVLRDLVPVGEDIGRVLGIAVQAVLPLAEDLGIVAKDAAPVVDIFTNLLGPVVKLGAALDPVNVAVRVGDAVLTRLGGAVSDLAELLAHLPGPLGTIETVVGKVVGFAESAAEKVGGVIGKVEGFLGAGSSSQDAFTKAVGDATKAQDDQSVAAIKDAAAHGLLTQTQTDAALAAKDHTAALAALQPAIDSNTISTQAAAAAYKPLVDFANSGAASLAAVTTESATAGNALSGLAAAGIHPTSAALVTFAVGMNSANLSTAGLDNAARALGITSAQLTGFLNGVSGAIASFTAKVVSGLPSVADAFKPVTTSAGSAGGAMANTASQALQAQRSIESAQHGIETANRGVVDSADALVKANQGVQASVDALTTAQKNLADAEQALADARNPAKPKDLEQANINLERAQLNVTKATDAVGKAEQTLADARRGVGTVSVHDAEIALQDARLSAEESTIRVSDAEDALNTVRQVGTEADKNVVSAEKAVETARNNVVTATAGIVTAQHQVEIAHRAVADAAYAAVQAEEALQQALIKPAASGGGGGGVTKQASVTLAEFVTNLETSTVKTRRFVDDLNVIFKAGDVALAGEIAQAGITAIGIADTAARGIATGDTALVTKAQQAVEAHNKVLADATKFVKDTFGPAYIASTGLVASLASSAFGDNLSFAAKLHIETQITAGTLSTDAATIQLIAGQSGAGAAAEYARLFNIHDPTFDQDVAAGKALANGTIPGAATDAAAAANSGYGTTLTDPKTGLVASTSDALAAAAADFERGGLGIVRAGSLSAGAGGLQGFVEGIHPIPDAAGSAVSDAGPAMTKSAGLVADLQATAAGASIGQAFAIGVALGMSPVRGSIAQTSIDSASAGLVAYAKQQVKFYAQSSSPSKVFAEIGTFLTLGLASGIEDASALSKVGDAAKKAVQAADSATRGAIAATTFPTGIVSPDLRAPNLRGLLATPAISDGLSTASSVPASVQNQITVAAGAIQVLFTGAVPTEAQAVSVGQQVEAGLIRALADREAQVNNRVLAK